MFQIFENFYEESEEEDDKFEKLTIHSKFGKSKETDYQKLRGKEYYLNNENKKVFSFDKKTILGDYTKIGNTHGPFRITKKKCYTITNIINIEDVRYYQCVITNRVYNFKKKNYIGILNDDGESISFKSKNKSSE